MLVFSACGTSKQIAALANKTLLQRSEVATAHVGISITDVNSGQSLYSYQGDKYFIPASNTKLLTCYAAMKHLGDSIEGLRYFEAPADMVATRTAPSSGGQPLAQYAMAADSNTRRADEGVAAGRLKTMCILPTGDPSFLHPDFSYQPVAAFLKRNKLASFVVFGDNWRTTSWGNGWAWSDYEDYYMAERSAFPIYGNVVRIRKTAASFSMQPSGFSLTHEGDDVGADDDTYGRDRNSNRFYRRPSPVKHSTLAAAKKTLSIDIPFMTALPVSVQLLRDTLGLMISEGSAAPQGALQHVIYSQPVDSVLRIMMHRSDNFLAEQSLLLVSNSLLRQLNEAAVIDSLLSTDYAGMPQAPRWVDGSGLSRYNLISPQDFTWLLHKMKQDFSWQRITGILETGGQGTLSGYYKQYAGRIYAKTGTLSNNVSLSGYLLTQKGKVLAFSVMVNNHKASVSDIRREVEAFLGGVIDKW
ncbi:D-alanyl-D-alanine carboxypeptidase/D-alanyl-D-alanine-endopeptidase [Filimonas effusa]|nr:D-alanyl-D-alanine carboxypeptidase [Filimonas effusa]